MTENHHQHTVPLAEPNRVRLVMAMPVAVLIACLFVTWQVWRNTRTHIVQSQQAIFEYRAHEVISTIMRRMEAYEQVLRGVQGLYAASATVQREEFKSYYAMLRLEESYPGIQGVGFVSYVRADEKKSHILQLQSQGLNSYRIWPDGERAAYAPVVVLEPDNPANRRAIGYDLYSDATRRAALERARDTGEAAITAKLRLVQEAGESSQAGTIMYLPVYRRGLAPKTAAARRERLVGWISAPFRMDDLMGGVLGERSHEMDVEIYTGEELSEQSLLYDDDNTRRALGGPLHLQVVRRVVVAGHLWTVVVSGLPEFGGNHDRREELIVAGTGTGFSLLLSLITWLLVAGRARALQMAHKERLTTHALVEAERLALVGHADYNPQSDQAKWSRGLERILGVAPQAAPRRCAEFMSFVHPDDLAGVLAVDQDQGWRETTFEFRVIRFDGEVRNIFAHSYRECDRSGAIIRMFAIVQDTTAWKQAEDNLKAARDLLEERVLERTAALEQANLELQESRALLKKAQQQARLGCWKWDVQRDLVTWSDELYELFGFDPSQPPPSYAEHGRLFAPESYHRLDHAIAHALATGDASKLHLDLEIIRVDGSRRFCLGRGEAVVDPGGRIVQLQGTLQDVTEWKLLEKQLFEARRLEAIGQLVGGVAHEVRNPLNAILSVTEALFREQAIEGNPDFEPYIHHIRTQVKRLAHLMNDLLDLGKPIEQSNLQPVGLRELCVEAVGLWQQANTETMRRIRVAEELVGSPSVVADGIKLQQAIINLLDNAAQHSSATAEIVLTLISSADGRMSCVRVTDSGSGIPDDRIGRVFEPFFSNRKGGTGLGLALVKHFVEGMGGSVAIWNNVDSSGCTAEICIPVAVEEAA